MKIGQVVIKYGALPNACENGGFVPAIWTDGIRQGGTYSSAYLDEAEAAAAAKARAEDEAERFIGDWEITIEEK